MERLQKRIAAAGVCSRRAAEILISEGRVKVNGVVVTEQGSKVEPQDEVEVDGKVLSLQKLVVLAMNKPPGYLTTMHDPFRRRTVAELLPDVGANIKPVGRLDTDTEGLLLFTNDGELAFRLTHPRFEIEKEYDAVVRGLPSGDTIARLEKGIVIEGKRTSKAKVDVVSTSKRGTRLRIIVHEGRKRQIRMMCEFVGHPIVDLKRVRMGGVYLNNLPKGGCRILGRDEVKALRKSVGI